MATVLVALLRSLSQWQQHRQHSPSLWQLGECAKVLIAKVSRVLPVATEFGIDGSCHCDVDEGSTKGNEEENYYFKVVANGRRTVFFVVFIIIPLYKNKFLFKLNVL